MSMFEYETALKSALDRLMSGQRLAYNEKSIELVRQTVLEVQSLFLNSHPEYVSAGPVAVRPDGDFNIFVEALVCTSYEKMTNDAMERLRVASYEEFKRQQIERDIQHERSRKNMLRQLRRLEAKHIKRLSYGVKSIWETLNEGQQYAILKDIDYDVRHGRMQ